MEGTSFPGRVGQPIGFVLILIMGSLAQAAEPQVEGPPELAALIVSLREGEDWSKRARAADDLGELGAKAAPAVPDLVGALEDENRFVRSSAAEALGKIGPEASGAASALVAALGDAEAFVRTGCLKALASINPPAQIALPGAVRSLDDPEGIVRLAALELLESLGESAQPALPAVIERFDTFDKFQRQAAGRVVAQLGSNGSEAIPVLMAAVKKGPEKPEIFVVLALEAIGPRGVHPLIRAAKGTDPGLAIRSRKALLYIFPGLGALPSRPEFLPEATTHENPAMREGAVIGVALAGNAEQKIIQELIRLASSDPHSRIRLYARLALGECGPAATAAVPLLTKSLRDSDPEFRWCAAVALGSIGPDARSAIPRLKEALEDQDANIRQAASEALNKIAPSEYPSGDRTRDPDAAAP